MYLTVVNERKALSMLFRYMLTYCKQSLILTGNSVLTALLKIVELSKLKEAKGCELLLLQLIYKFTSVQGIGVWQVKDLFLLLSR